MSALLAAGEAMAADFRCADLRPSQSQTPPYQRIAGQARCEGFFDQHVSQPFIELVSLTASAPPKQEQGVLELRASRRAAVQLVVQPLRPAPFYRVDALVEAAQAMRWDDAQMLGATGLRRRDIGFLALAPGPDGMPTYVPVTFADAGEAPEVASGVLRASVPVARLAWRSLRGDGSDDGSGGWHDLPGPARFAWERVPIELQLPRGGRGVQINVQATDAAGKILPLLRFNLAGPADAIP
ncbi:hypothetical protein ASF44_06955 [Pseudorhodoferax sp. Leaf274]|nr:hypothetical protein ASF44_06955 [Pseudorhodoferax sp. Leaf274]